MHLFENMCLTSEIDWQKSDDWINYFTVDFKV